MGRVAGLVVEEAAFVSNIHMTTVPYLQCQIESVSDVADEMIWLPTEVVDGGERTRTRLSPQ